MNGDMIMNGCAGCGYSRPSDHPINLCPKCDEDGYNARFAELRQRAARTYLLGTDHYADVIYVWAGGVVAGIEGRTNRMLRYTQTDRLTRRITDLEAENKDLLAENARMRRRLEGKRTTNARSEE